MNDNQGRLAAMATAAINNEKLIAEFNIKLNYRAAFSDEAGVNFISYGIPKPINIKIADLDTEIKLQQVVDNIKYNRQSFLQMQVNLNHKELIAIGEPEVSVEESEDGDELLIRWNTKEAFV